MNESSLLNYDSSKIKDIGILDNDQVKNPDTTLHHPSSSSSSVMSHNSKRSAAFNMNAEARLQNLMQTIEKYKHQEGTDNKSGNSSSSALSSKHSKKASSSMFSSKCKPAQPSTSYVSAMDGEKKENALKVHSKKLSNGQ